jgi:hypothetical protein
MKFAPQCGLYKPRSSAVRHYTLLCICKSSRQTGNLPGGMKQAGHTAPQCGSRKIESRSARGTEQAPGMLGGQLFGPGATTTPE